MRRKRSLLTHVAFVSAASMLFATAASADEPKSLVRSKYDQIEKILKTDKTDAGVRKKVVEVLESFTDFRSFGQRTLKRHWKGLTEAQRTLFVDRFRLLIHKSYVKHFKAGKVLKVDVQEAIVKGDKALVKTTVTSGKTEAEVNYKLHTVEGALKAYDIVIDDVSLMRSYRKQFSKIYKRDGFDKLISKINRKIDKGDGEVADP